MLKTYLQNSKLVHFLARTSRNHILQCRKLLIHLGPPSPLNQAMCRFSSNLPPSRTCRTGLFLLTPIRRSRGTIRRRRSRFPRLLRSLPSSRSCIRFRRGTLLSLGLHLDNLPRTGGRRRQVEILQRTLGTSTRTSTSRRLLACTATQRHEVGRYWRRREMI